jgi:hypothetical protein
MSLRSPWSFDQPSWWPVNLVEPSNSFQASSPVLWNRPQMDLDRSEQFVRGTPSPTRSVDWNDSSQVLCLLAPSILSTTAVYEICAVSIRKGGTRTKYTEVVLQNRVSPRPLSPGWQSDLPLGCCVCL